MRKLVVILLPLLPLFIHGQLLNTVDQIASYNNPYNQLVFVKDTIRGGQFMPYNGASPADNGLIFQDALGRKWIRQAKVDFMDVRWFGAKADGSDTRAAFIAAINSAKANLPSVKIKFPQTATNNYYYFSDSVAFDSYVEIFGDGHESKLKFAQHKKGFVFTYPETHYSVLRDIYISATSSAGSPANTWDSSKHGIIVKSPVYFSNVWVNGFDGCGIYIVNSLESSNPGNASTSVFSQCHSYYNLLHGIYIQGADVNAITFTNCDIVGNGGVGIYDKSFLGNHYAYNHIASNGSPELTTQRGLVKKDGVVYACIKDTTKNVTPPNAIYWQVVDNSWLAYAPVQTYDATKTYYAVGSLIMEGSNQYGSLIGNYSELDQAPGYIDIGNTDIRSNIVCRNVPTRLYSSLGRLTSLSLFSSDVGITSKWMYGGDMANTVDPVSAYPNSSGILVGSSNKSAIVDFWNNGTKIGDITTSSTKLLVTADTVNIVGTLQNNGSPISGGGVSQSALNDTASNLRGAIATKQDAGSYLTTTGNGSGLTGLTKSQVGLGNVDNTSDADKPISNATQTALDAKQSTLVPNSNIKTVGGQSVLGSGNIVTTNSQTFVSLASNFSTSSNVASAVTGWSFAVTSGITYRITVIGAHQTAATTTGAILGISLTTATGTIRGSARGSIVSTAANSELAIPIVATSGAGSTLTTTGVTAINSPHFISLDVIFICTGTGTFNIIFGTEVNGSAAQLNAGSALIYQALN